MILRFFKVLSVGLIVILLFLLTACDLDIAGVIDFFDKDVSSTTHSHEWSTWRQIKVATCDENGSMERNCVCGETELTEIEAIGHTAGELIILNERAASCLQEGGYDEVQYCLVCGDEVYRNTVIYEKQEHTETKTAQYENIVDPTCTDQGGYDKVFYCTVCNQELRREHRTLAPNGHKEGASVVEKKIEATCVTPGSYDEVRYCTVCDLESSRNSKVIPATGHNSGAEVVENLVAATCLESGKCDKVIYCTKCFVEISRSPRVIRATGHKLGEWIIDVDATCAEEGSKHQICSVCTDTIKTESIPLKDHTAGEWIVDFDATCTEEGSKHQICLVCATSINTGTILAKGHTAGEWITVREPTCIENGQENQNCADCGIALYTRTLHAKHNYIVTQQLPTCLSSGSTTVTCTRCLETHIEEWTPITFEIDTGNYYLDQGQNIIYYLQFTIESISGGCVNYDLSGNKIQNKYEVTIYNTYLQEYETFNNITENTGIASKRFYGGTDIFSKSVFQITISDGKSTYVYYLCAFTYEATLVHSPVEHHSWNYMVCGQNAVCQDCGEERYISHTVMSGSCDRCGKTVYMPQVSLPTPTYIQGGGKLQSISCVPEGYVSSDYYLTLNFTFEYLKNGIGFTPGFRIKIYDYYGSLVSSQLCIMEESDMIDGIYQKTVTVLVVKSSSYQVEIVRI